MVGGVSMKKFLMNIVSNTVYIPIMLLSFVIFIFFFAKLIELNYLSINSAEILVLILIIISTSIGTYIAERKFGNGKIAITLSCVIFILLITFSFAINPTEFSLSVFTKDLIALISGTILGIYFGNRKHYKLRNNRKKRISTTK